MKKQLFTTDESIIIEYSRLYNELGVSEECLSAIDNLAELVSPEKQEIWKHIFKGIKYDIKGDIEKSQDKQEETKAFYEKSYQEFNNISISDKESLIACFVERKRLTELANDDVDILKVVVVGLQNLINKFEHCKNPVMQAEVVESKRYLSFFLTKLAEKQAESILSDIVKNTNPTNIMLQVSIINAMFNQADLLQQKANNDKKQSEKFLEEAITIYTKIIDDFNNYTDNPLIEKNIAIAINKKGSILYQIDRYGETIELLEPLINKYENIQNNFYASLVCDALESLVKTYEMQSKFANCGGKDNLEKAINVLDKIITFKKFNHLKKNVIKALEKKANILKEEMDISIMQQRKQESIDIYSELIELCRDDNDYKRDWYEALEEKGKLLLESINQEKTLNSEKAALLLGIYESQISMVDKTQYKVCEKCDACMVGQSRNPLLILQKARLLFRMERYEESIKDYDSVIKICNEFGNNYISQHIFSISQYYKGAAIFNIASALSAKECYKEAIEKFDFVINLFRDTKDANEQELLEVAKRQKKDIEEILLPISEIIKFFPQNKHNIDYLVQSVIKGKIIPVIGAGLSRFTGGYPLWKEFLQSIYDTNKKIIPINRNGFFEMTCKEQADTICKYLGRDTFKEQVRRVFAKKEMSESVKNEAIGLIPQLFSEHLIMTTNLDLVIESIYGLNGNPIKSYTQKDIISIRKSNTSNSSILYKLHGSIEDVEEAVFTSKEFDKCYEKESNNYNILHEKMQNNDRLFLGCNLIEGNEILRFCEGGGTNYAIYPCKKEDLRKVSRTLGEQKISSPILYPIKNDNEHLYLKIILDYIALQINNVR